ncbi:MAG: LysM peptidoglycan-binding domain-containing protein [Oceanococcus sp.]
MANYKGLCRQRLWAGAMLFCAALGLSAQAQAQDSPVLNPDVPLEYVVKSGDTLWDIAEYYLRDPWLWPELWNANPQVANPHLIFPGEILYLVWVDGKPRLQRERPLQQASTLKRMSPQVRRSSLEAAIPTIPLDEILAFLNGPRVIDKDSYEIAPHIIAFEDDRLLGSDEAAAYVRGGDEANGFAYSVIRIGQKYRDPDDGDILGYEAIPVALATVEEFGEISSAQLSESNREVRILDRLFPTGYSEFRADFFPSAPGQEIEGRIIAVFNGVSQIGQYQIVTLNRGTSHGVQPGHVLQVKQAGKKVKDPKAWALSPRVRLPDMDAGHLMVFKTFERLSYGLIMRATRPIHVQDKVVNPVPGA